jgi:heptosyltransferase-2/heptosyltransferase-3
VLVVRPDHLGDLLMTTPALGLLRAALPEAEITALVGPWARPVLAGRTEVDRVETCAFPGFTRRAPGLPLAPYARLVWEGLRLRRARYDAALVLRVDHWWGAALVACAGIPLRLGYAVPESRAFLTHALPADFAQHSVRESWRVVGALLDLLGRPMPEGAPPAVRATASPAGCAAAVAFLAERGVALDQPLVAIHPGTGADVKRWPAARWAEVADALVAERGARVVVTGSAEERDVVGAVVAAMERPAVAAAGSLDWDALGGLLARCALVLGVDSGPLHLAAALGVPTTHVFGPTDPRRFGPWGAAPLHRVIRVPLACSPCGNLIAPPCGEHAEPACMRGVAPAAVLKAATEAMDAAAVVGTARVAGRGA